MAHSLTSIGIHLECAVQAEMVGELEIALMERKQSSISAQIHQMQENYETVRKCAKVKGRVELKIDKTQSKDP